MQTFLPYVDFHQSFECLDPSRQNKQIVEGVQILRILSGDSNGGYINHPAVKMWAEYELALLQYVLIGGQIYENRKIKKHNSIFQIPRKFAGAYSLSSDFVYPPWLGQENLHASHRARLLHKGNIDLIRAKLGKNANATCESMFDKKGMKLREITVFQSKLLVKIFKIDLTRNWYRKFNWTEEPSNNYIWPI